MLQGIENIVFDIGGVMIDLDRARCVEEFHKIGFTEIDDLIDSYHPKGFLGRLERGDVTNDDFYDYVRRSAGRDIADDEIRRAFTSFLAGIPRYKLQMVRTQRERGFRTYALSNINDVVFLSYGTFSSPRKVCNWTTISRKPIFHTKCTH